MSGRKSQRVTNRAKDKNSGKNRGKGKYRDIHVANSFNSSMYPFLKLLLIVSLLVGIASE